MTHRGRRWQVRAAGTRRKRQMDCGNSTSGATANTGYLHWQCDSCRRASLVERDQPVVLALTNGRLAIYDYASQTPIDTLLLTQLLSALTVVYDDNRVPHVEVMDSAALALQLTFSHNSQTWICLFRHMQNVRLVDWYHALQQVRFSASEKV